MSDENYWKTFESSGSIEHYLQYKQHSAPQQPSNEEQEHNADYNHGSGSAGG